MFAAITLFVVLTFSVVVIRIAAVALRITGLSEETARFQARSAFTGTGFTTGESEALVNHPLRRRIVGTLMLVGNLGLVSALATVIVSLVGTGMVREALLDQLFWLGGCLLVLWFVALNPIADRLMCRAIGRLIAVAGLVSDNGPKNLLDLPQGHCIARIPIGDIDGAIDRSLDEIGSAGLAILGLCRADGRYLDRPGRNEHVLPQDEIIAYGPFVAVEAFGENLHRRTTE